MPAHKKPAYQKIANNVDKVEIREGESTRSTTYRLRLAHASFRRTDKKAYNAVVVFLRQGNGRGRVHRRVRGSVSPLASWSPIAARVVRRRRPVQSTHTEEHTPVNPGSTAANTHPGDAVPAIPRARGHRAGPPLVVDAKLVVLLHETPRKTKTPIKDKTKTIDSTTAPNLQDAAAQGTDGSSAPRVASSRSRTSDEPHIGKYKLLKTIGKGNFAKVKLAKHVPTGKEVKNLSEVPRELVEEKLRAKYLQ